MGDDAAEREEQPVPIPEHLSGFVLEAIEEAIREAAEDSASSETRQAVIKAVHYYDGFMNKSLTAGQTAELAHRAAGWLWPRWPRTVEEADEVAALLAATRDLLELRDRAVVVAAERGEPEADIAYEHEPL